KGSRVSFSASRRIVTFLPLASTTSCASFTFKSTVRIDAAIFGGSSACNVEVMQRRQSTARKERFMSIPSSPTMSAAIGGGDEMEYPQESLRSSWGLGLWLLFLLRRRLQQTGARLKVALAPLVR